MTTSKTLSQKQIAALQRGIPGGDGVSKRAKPRYPNMGMTKKEAKRAKFMLDNRSSSNPPKWNGMSVTDVYGKYGGSPSLQGNLNEQNRRNIAAAEAEKRQAKRDKQTAAGAKRLRIRDDSLKAPKKKRAKPNLVMKYLDR